jgi:hypothetical protein
MSSYILGKITKLPIVVVIIWLIISLINQQLFQNITLVTAAVVGLKLIIF